MVVKTQPVIDWASFKSFGVEFVCPACRGQLESGSDSLRCAPCGVVYPIAGEQPDLRLRLPSTRTHEFLIGEHPVTPTVGPIRPTTQADPTVAWNDPATTLGNGLTPGLLERIPVAADAEAVLLDVGCGGQDSPGAIAARARGYLYLGLDYEGDAAGALADAHALPLPDESVDCVASFGVIEHLSDPFEATREVFRVLRPGGIFVGTVSFLEPFHLDSYFHMTHLGIAHVLRRGGFELLELEANEDWLAQDAVDAMQPRYGRVTQLRFRATRRLRRAVRALIRRVRPGSPDYTRNLTGGFRFVAQRAAAEG